MHLALCVQSLKCEDQMVVVGVKKGQRKAAEKIKEVEQLPCEGTKTVVHLQLEKKAGREGT